jgi:predicted transcriptional regulator
MESAMANKPLNVTEYELAVLEALWERRQATIREITEEIYGQVSTTAYATVQKLLERLERKGYVRRDRRSFAHVFRARVDRSHLIGQGLESLAAKLCGGSLTPLLVHLAETTELTEEERKTLRRLIDEAE